MASPTDSPQSKMAAVRASFAPGWLQRVPPVKKVDRTAGPSPAFLAEQAARAARRAFDAADRAAGLYVPTPCERDYLEEYGLSPSEVAARRCIVDIEDPASVERLQRRAADLTAYVERRRPTHSTGSAGAENEKQGA